jgi:hypothetical protein
MRHDLVDDPAVIALTEQTSCVDEEHVIGKLHKLWSWADRQTTDGSAPNVTVSWVDRFLGIPGFAAVLTSVGWLEPNGDGFAIPKFEEHISQSAKQRALTSRRVSNHRRNAPSVTKVLPEKRKEEKKREEDSSTSTTTSFWNFVKTRAQAVSVRLIAAKGERWRRTRDMKSIVLHACGLVEMGSMPEGWLNDAVEAVVTAEKVDNPTGFLADRLTKYAAMAGKDFATMRRALKIPEELLERKPNLGPED